jgi:hypothetical protein
MSYTVQIQSGQLIGRKSPDISVWETEPDELGELHAFEGGPSFNNASTVTGVFGTLREAYDAATAHTGLALALVVVTTPIKKTQTLEMVRVADLKKFMTRVADRCETAGVLASKNGHSTTYHNNLAEWT